MTSAAVSGACAEPLGPDIDYITVSVSLSQSEMSLGDTTEIQVTAHNPTDRPLTFRTNTCILGVRLLDLTGHSVFQDPSTCDDIGLQHELAPGESMVETFSFDGSARRSVREPGQPAWVFLAPGEYQVIGGISGRILNPSSPVQLRIRSDS